MNRSPEITHVIFDMDGVLLDTERFYTEVASRIAARYGKVFDWALKAKMIGLRSADSGKLFLADLDIPLSLPEYLALRRTYLEELFPDAEPMPGAVALTRRLHRHGVPIAVASSSDHHYFELKTRRHREWFSIFSCIVVGDDPEVKNGKPAPDVFRVVARRLGASPGSCLVFEDAPAGVEGAREAGMYAIAVADPNMAASAYPGAHEVLRSLEEFRPAAWGLPAMDAEQG